MTHKRCNNKASNINQLLILMILRCHLLLIRIIVHYNVYYQYDLIFVCIKIEKCKFSI